MSNIIKEIEAEQLKETVDQFEVGDTVKVYGKIKEGNRERIQVFEGVVLKRQGGSNRETFTVRKTSRPLWKWVRRKASGQNRSVSTWFPSTIYRRASSSSGAS